MTETDLPLLLNYYFPHIFYLVFAVTFDQLAPCYIIIIIPVPLGPMAAVFCLSNPSLSFLSTITR
jgi:hypothetical protein